MANLPETSVFPATIYQIETTDPVVGGVAGISNQQPIALGNRTRYLKDHVDALETSRGAASGIATLDAGGKLLVAQLPNLAITNTFVVASQAAMLALTAQLGDLAVRTDLGGDAYVLATEPASTLANWQVVGNRSDLAAHVAAADPHPVYITQAELDAAWPVGTVIWRASSTAPAGFLKANGAAISRITYASLFGAIGVVFGTGDGSTTFNLPDMRGEFPRGWDDGRGVDAGRAFGTAQSDTYKAHTHTALMWELSTLDPTGGTIFVGADAGGSPHANPGETYLSGSTETRPRNVALLACIRF